MIQRCCDFNNSSVYGSQFTRFSINIFGSYARGEANQQSDVDIMIKKGNLKTLLQLSALAYEIEQILKKQIDIVVEETYTKDINYDSETIKLAKNIFYNEVKKERLNIYE